MLNGLEGCPFCGSEHVFCTDWHEGRGYGIKCDDCGKIWGPFTKPETAYEEWNKRAKKSAKVTEGTDLNERHVWVCSECGTWLEGDTVFKIAENYCPNCGAKLIWED